MDEKNIPVFDFTKGGFRYVDYWEAIQKTRNNYSVGEVIDGRIIITITTIEKDNYKLVYWYKSCNDIYNMILQGQPLDLRRCYIKDFNIKNIPNYQEYILNFFDATDSFWDGNTTFERAKFDNNAVQFKRAFFGNGKVTFDITDFGDGNVSFEQANFGVGIKSFALASFGIGNVSFNSTNFGLLGKVSFDSVDFGTGDVIFTHSTFGDGNIYFDYADFGEGAITFRNATFWMGEISFKSTNFNRGELSFFSVDFGEANVLFEDIDFLEDTVFFALKGKSLIFIDSKFRSHMDLRLEKMDRFIMQNCIIEKTLMCDWTKYEELSFFQTVNLGQIYIDWDRNSVGNAIKKGKWSFNFNEESHDFTSEELASQFRMLKENYRNIGYYDDEDKAYRAYMKYKRKSLKGTSTIIQLIKDKQEKHLFRKSCKRVWNSFKKAFYMLFGLVGGYGTQAWSILLTALLTIFGFGMLQYFFEWIEFTNGRTFTSKFWESMYFSGITFFTIGFGDVTPVNQLAGMMAVLEGFLGVTLMSYFVVALVRKLLR